MKGLGVGRTVHYVAYGTPGGEFPAGICRAAIITETYAVDNLPPVDPQRDVVHHVDEEGQVTSVGLCVLNPTGLFFNRGIAYDPDKKPGTWHWPETK